MRALRSGCTIGPAMILVGLAMADWAVEWTMIAIPIWSIVHQIELKQLLIGVGLSIVFAGFLVGLSCWSSGDNGVGPM